MQDRISIVACLSNISLFDYARIKYFELKFKELTEKLNAIIGTADAHAEDKALAQKVLDTFA